jgi:magnesium transporter
MLRSYKTPNIKLGSAPGTIHDATSDSFITCTSFDEDDIEHFSCETIDDCIKAVKQKNKITWLNITGLAGRNILRELGKHLDLHDLVLENLQDSSRPLKFEEFDEFVFIIVKSLIYNYRDDSFCIVDNKIIVGENYVITFCEKPIPMYLKLFKRISLRGTKLRRHGLQYFLFALLDVMNDGSYDTLNIVIDKMDSLEQIIEESPKDFDLTEIYHIKQLMENVKRSLWRYIEVINGIKNSEYLELTDDMLPYYKDLEEHCTHMRYVVDSIHSAATDMFNLHISLNAQKMSEIMKVLTLFSAFFIPLMFITGVYGMNFNSMPELTKPWGYPAALGLMASIAGGMFFYFKRKGWF